MKKVLALVLAVMMMATVAFAASNYDEDGFLLDVNNPATADAVSHRLPGKKININAQGVHAQDPNYKFTDSGYNPDVDTDKLLKDINSTNYTLTAVKYSDGKNLVESIKFNDKEDRVEIKLKPDYDLTKVKKLDMTFILKGKKSGKTKPADIRIRVIEDVNFARNLDVLKISLDNEVKLGVVDFDEDTVYEVEESDPDKDGRKQSYGTMEFTVAADDEVDVEVRVYDGDRFYLYNSVEADDDVLKAYADTDADLTFLDFPGTPTFNATATVRFYKEEGTHIYNNKDGKLSACNAKWDDDEGCFILKTRTLGSYVFSDKALSVSTSTAADNNPDTGANDVVGIATALAAVALVSAAAVSLKK